MTQPMIESHQAYDGEPYVYTSSGRRFYLNRPEFYIDDIAHALCNNVRFNGHIRVPYSIGQHSMLVADITEELWYDAQPEEMGMAYDEDPNEPEPSPPNKLILEALLHDGTEAYLSDIPSPFKQLLPDWKAIDRHLESAMRAQFGLPLERDPLVTKADWLALFMEAHQLLPAGVVKEFKDPLDLREEALDMMFHFQWDEHIIPMKLERDVHNFTSYFGEVRNA